MQGLSKAESILFDCGLLTTEGLNCNSVFITHGHIDHIGACISHARGESNLHICSTTVTMDNSVRSFIY